MDRKLNICVVQPNRATYSETFIRNHINYLPANVYNTYGPGLPEYDGSDTPLRNIYLKRNFFSHAAAYLLKILPYSIFTRLNSAYTGLPFKDNRLLERSFKYYLRLRKIDVVLAEYGFKGAIVQPVCEELAIPFIVHFHGADAYDKTILAEYADGYQKIFLKASSLVVVSERMRNTLVEMGAPTEKLHLIHYGVDISLFKQSDVRVNKNVLITIGRFVDKKAPHLTILAFSKALKKCEDAKLILIGDGPLMESCRSLAIALGVEKNIEFKGVQTQQQISVLLNEARAFVLHSVTTNSGDSEGTPNVVLEAAASGLPVISTWHAGIPDVIEHGVTGFLVKERDVEDMADCMIQLLSDANLADEMGNAAREKVVKNFRMEDQINKLMMIIKNASETKVYE